MEQQRVFQATARAALRIEQIRLKGEFHVQAKADASPVTAADLAAHEEFAALGWRHLISEEDAHRLTPEQARAMGAESLWLVDPLDGTRDLIHGELSFAVIAGELTRDSGGAYVPRFGIIWHPPTNDVWVGWVDRKELWSRRSGRWEKHLPQALPERWRGMGSRGLSMERLQALSDRLGLGREPQVRRLGSALKFALMAVGEAEIYPRFGPTSEWDTAAGQALLEAVGGGLWDITTQTRLAYLKPEWENQGGFLALRGSERADEVLAETTNLKLERDRSVKEKK